MEKILELLDEFGHLRYLEGSYGPCEYDFDPKEENREIEAQVVKEQLIELIRAELDCPTCRKLRTLCSNPHKPRPIHKGTHFETDCPGCEEQ